MGGPSLNRVQVIGYLGRDPESRCTSTGTKIATFSVATTERWKDRDGNWQERTEWHRVTAWAGLAEVVTEHLRKGSKVYIEGSLETRSWEKDGQTHYSTEIRAEQVIFFDRPAAAPPAADHSRGGGGYGRQQPAPAPPLPADPNNTDDIPF